MRRIHCARFTAPKPKVFRLTIAPKVKLLGTCPFQVRFIIRDPTGAEFRTGTGTTSANRYRDRYQALSPEPVLDSVIDAETLMMSVIT